MVERRLYFCGATFCLDIQKVYICVFWCLFVSTYWKTWASLVPQWWKFHLPVQEIWVLSLSQKDLLEKGMATHSNILTWKILWMKELVGYSPWGHKELDMTKQLNNSWGMWALKRKLLHPVVADRGWDSWMASPTWWIWVWPISRSWWWTGKPGILQSMGSQRVRHDWETELDWIVPEHKDQFTFYLCWKQESLVVATTFQIMSYLKNIYTTNINSGRFAPD